MGQVDQCPDCHAAIKTIKAGNGRSYTVDAQPLCSRAMHTSVTLGGGARRILVQGDHAFIIGADTPKCDVYAQHSETCNGPNGRRKR